MPGGGEVYGAFHYASLYGGSRTGTKEHEAATRAVFNFKRHGRGAERMLAIVTAAASALDCKTIVAMPSAGVELNRMQEAFGARLVRTRPVARRKYSHASDLPADYASSVKLDMPDVARGARVLLADDVATTGRSLVFYGDVLRKAGYDPVLFSLGISARLSPVKVGELALSAPADQAAAAGEPVTPDGGDATTLYRLRCEKLATENLLLRQRLDSERAALRAEVENEVNQVMDFVWEPLREAVTAAALPPEAATRLLAGMQEVNERAAAKFGKGR